MSPELFKRLLADYYSGSIQKEEVELLARTLHDPQEKEQLQAMISGDLSGLAPADAPLTLDYIYQDVLTRNDIDKETPIRKLSGFTKKWLLYAAALILAAGAGIYFWLGNTGTGKPQTAIAAAATDIAPGTHRAILTIDGRTIDLAAGKTGITIGKTLSYSDGESLPETSGEQLTLRTPKGGQYQLVLPDGSKVWLNAASSISFPSAFTAARREIQVTGEVYLEVAPAARPFIVNANTTEIQVLGTNFNINAYADEPGLATTLVNGSVRVVSGKSDKLLNPGEQAIVTSSGPVDNAQPDIRIRQADIDAVLAWKNGLFQFNRVPLTDVMRQLSRWYDVEVVYERNVSDVRFWGEIKKDLNLAQVLDGLKDMGVQFRIEGKKLIVL